MTTVVSARTDMCVLAAVARPGRLRVLPGDQAWAQRIVWACADRLPLIGVHLVTPKGVLAIEAEPHGA